MISRALTLAKTLLVGAAALITVFAGATARAGAVADVYGKSITFVGHEGMVVGQTYYTVDSKGLRVSIVKITSLTEEGGAAEVLKGKASPGERMIPRGSAPVAKTVVHQKPLPEKEGRDFNPESARAWGWRIGLGVSYFTLQGSSYKSSLGFAASLLADLPIWHFDLTTGLGLYQSGGAYSADGFDTKLTLTYVSLPLELRYAFYRSDEGAFRLLGGTSFGYRVSTSGTVSGNGASLSLSDNSGDPLDFGWLLGLGYAVRSEGRDSYWMDLQYYNGLRTFTGGVHNVGALLLFGAGF